ncbi:MAG: hypothetical protein ACQESW_06745 [Bacteroidota bacterium]
MRLFLFTLTLFLVQMSYAQKNSIEISLSSGQTLSTSWLELHTNSFFRQPYITIDSTKGRKISIAQLTSYQGWDQKGNYRKLLTQDLPFPEGTHFTELFFSKEETERVTLFYHKSIFPRKNNTYTFTDVRYSLPEETIQKVTYRNVQQTFQKLNPANKTLKKARYLQHAQWLSTGIALALLTEFLRDNYHPNDKTFMQKSDEVKLLASGLFFTLPLVLEKPKRKKLIEALREL